MSKKAKLKRKLLNQKTLTSDEAVRLLELDGWIPDKNSAREEAINILSIPSRKAKLQFQIMGESSQRIPKTIF